MTVSGAVPDLVAHAAETSPDEVVLGDDGARRLDGTALEARVAARAGYLSERGVGPGTRVAILPGDRLEAVVDLLAVIRTGGVAAPVDPTLPAVALERRLETGNISAAIAENPDALASSIETIGAGTGDSVDGRPIPVARPLTLAFTSGTLGEPTPVVHTAWNHVAAGIASAQRLGVEDDDRWYDPLALYHMGGLAPVTRCLVAGMPLVIADEVGSTDLLERLDVASATIVSVVPPMLEAAVDATAPVPASLRCVLVGGAPLADELFTRARAVDLPVYASYGLTETLGQVASASPAERAARPGTVGRPLPGVSVDVRDEAGQACPPGETGELQLVGPTLAPAEGGTDPARRGALHTRDRGRRDAAGYLWVVGRADDAIVSGGVVVHPAAVVAALEAHPAVRAAGAVGVADDRWGEIVAAGVLTRDDAAVDADDLRAHCRDRLERAAVPRRIALLEALPRTPSGTVDRAALRARLDA